ncbi:hypothetical protein EON62_04120, partial [archaeon]
MSVAAGDCTTTEGGNLTVALGETCTWSAGTYTFNQLTILGTVTVINEVSVSAIDFNLTSTGTISGVGHGFSSNTGPGISAGNGNGAAHAGCGGQGTCSTDPSATSSRAYGSVFAPTMMGSGGHPYASYQGAAGGGALRLIVSGTAQLDGTIDMSAATTTTSMSGG